MDDTYIAYIALLELKFTSCLSTLAARQEEGTPEQFTVNQPS